MKKVAAADRKRRTKVPNSSNLEPRGLVESKGSLIPNDRGWGMGGPFLPFVALLRKENSGEHDQ